MATTYKDPGTKVDPDVRKICAEIIREFPAIPNVWGYATFPDHNNRRCIDYMVIGQGSDAKRVALGNAIAAYHIKHAKRLGVNGIIWNRRVMGFPHSGGQNSYRGPYGKWRTYTGTQSHTDHVHVEYDGSAYVPLTPPKPAGPTQFAFWVAQWNLLNPAWDDPGDLSWAKRLPTIVSKVKAASVSVFLANECTKEMAADVQDRLGAQWEWDRVGVNAVFRDKAKWPQRRLIEKVLPGNGTRSLVAVDLLRAGTNITIRFGAFHLETLASGYAKTEAEAQKLRDEQMRAAGTALTSGDGHPAIVVAGGDLNDTDDKTGPRAIARTFGLKPLGDYVKVKNSTLGTTDSHRHLDDVFVRRATVTSAELIDGGSASDHNLTRARVYVSYP